VIGLFENRVLLVGDSYSDVADFYRKVDIAVAISAQIKILHRISAYDTRRMLLTSLDFGVAVSRSRPQTVHLPKRLGLPPDAYMGVKEIDFRPGEHTVDVYRHLNSERLFTTNGTITSVGGVPILSVKLKMGELPSGQYVVGISGDPYFGYCTIDFE